MKRKEIVIGEDLDLVDFIKAYPVKALDGLAESMKREGGDHPFAWCIEKLGGSIKEPQAICASAHLKAFGATPAQRRAKEKTSE